jgi:lipid-A-disaccharide synthase
MVQAAEKIHKARPDVRFLVASYKEKQAIVAREMLSSTSIPFELYIGKTPEIIELATTCVAVSGSVGLELLVRVKPTVVVYKMTKTFTMIASRMITCPYISLVNLLANERLFPEYPTTHDESDTIAFDTLKWLNSPEQLAESVRRLTELRTIAAIPGAVNRAADFLISELT